MIYVGDDFCVIVVWCDILCGLVLGFLQVDLMLQISYFGYLICSDILYIVVILWLSWYFDIIHVMFSDDCFLFYVACRPLY